MSERKDRNVPTLDRKKIEGVIDEMYVALAVRRRLCLRETLFIDAAEFAVEIGGLDVHILESLDGSRIFGGPIEAGPGGRVAHVCCRCGPCESRQCSSLAPHCRIYQLRM